MDSLTSELDMHYLLLLICIVYDEDTLKTYVVNNNQPNYVHKGTWRRELEQVNKVTMPSGHVHYDNQ